MTQDFDTHLLIGPFFSKKFVFKKIKLISTSQKTVDLSYKDGLVNAVQGVITVFFDDHTKLVNPPGLYGQNTGLFSVKVDGAHGTPGTHSYHCALKCLLSVFNVLY